MRERRRISSVALRLVPDHGEVYALAVRLLRGETFRVGLPGHELEVRVDGVRAVDTGRLLLFGDAYELATMVARAHVARRRLRVARDAT